MAPIFARVVGGPGAGKTRRLLEIIDMVINRLYVDPMQIGFVSFTRAARSEAASRAAAKFGIPAITLEKEGYFRTLHSVCYKQLGIAPGELITGSKDDVAWMRNTLQDAAYASSVRGDNDDAMTIGGESTPASRALAMWDATRNRLVPFGVVWGEAANCDDKVPPRTYCERIIKRYEEKKREDGRVDFCDLLMLFAGKKWSGDWPGAFADEEPHGESPDLPVWFHDECLPGDSLVSMADGRRLPIREIVENKINGDVLSFNEKTGEVESKPIVSWHKSPRRGREIIKIGNARMTEDHLVFTKELGWISSKECNILNNTQDITILEVSNEDLSADGIDRDGAKYRSWRHSWRCLHSKESRGERELPSCIPSRRSAVGISPMESRTNEAVDCESDNRADRNFIRRACLFIFNSFASRIHRNSQSVFAKLFLPRVRENADAFGVGDLLYGRWLGSKDIKMPASEFGSHARSGLFGVGLQINGQGACRDGCSVDSELRQKEEAIDWNSSWGKEIPWHRGAFHCSVDAIQVGRGRKACVADGNSGDEGSAGEMPNMPNGVREKEIGIALRQERMLHENEREETEGVTSEEEVYCIGVADNQNFFAENTLVHNCQDTSLLASLVFARLVKNSRWGYIAGDENQSIFSWAGADGGIFGNWKVDKEDFLPQSHRCPSEVLDFGKSIIRDPRLQGFAPVHQGGLVDRFGIDEAMSQIKAGKDTLVLARTNDLARKASSILDQRGIPWKMTKGNGGFNAPARAAGVAAILALRRGEGIDPIAIHRMMDLFPVKLDGVPLFEHGAKAHYADKDVQANAAVIDPVGLANIEAAGGTQAFKEMIGNESYLKVLEKEDPPAAKMAVAAKEHGIESVINPSVRVGTCHSAKGMEAEHVVLFDQIPYPTMRAIQTGRGMEEERRVFYVSATRASERLTIASCEDKNKTFPALLPQ